MDEQNLTGGNGEVKSVPESPKDKNSSMRLFVLLGLVAVVVGGMAALGAYKVYTKLSRDKFSLAVAKAFNFPAVKVAGEKIPYVAYAEDLKAIHTMRDYDQSQRDAGVPPDRSPGADLTEEQMSDQVLWRLVNNLLVNNAAKKYSVTVEDDDIKNLKAQMLQQFKDEATASEELMKRYGWDMKVYEQKVMRPFIVQTKLAKKMKEDPKMKEDLRAQAEKALEEIKKGADFAALAKKYNTDSTGERGGDLGWFGKGEMVPEFEQAAFSLKKGEVYPTVVESVYGYHIIKLDDRKTSKVKNEKGQNVNAEQVRASQVLFRFPDILSYLDQAARDGNIHLYLKVHNPFTELNVTATEKTSTSE
ncbi:MAG: protein export chaperone [Parcubacteria group bacterium Gr01-1014_13]|nr:MAG: protein export chaperone [Parcubacteria group bacterium Gr01-1014_13]